MKSVVNDITNDLIDFNAQKENEDEMKAREILCSIVKNFADVKQLSENTNFVSLKLLTKNYN